MSLIHEPHNCDDELNYATLRRSPSPGSIFECECGRRFIKGKWTGLWRRLRRRGYLPAFVRRWLEAKRPQPASHPMVDHPTLYGRALGEATIAAITAEDQRALDILHAEHHRIIRADREASEQRTPQDRERQADVRRRAFGVES